MVQLFYMFTFHQIVINRFAEKQNTISEKVLVQKKKDFQVKYNG